MAVELSRGQKMKRTPSLMSHFAIWIATFVCVTPITLLTPSAKAVDIVELERALANEGLVGWVHGSSPDQSLFVLTYRNPNDFFDSVDMSMVAYDQATRAQLHQLKRHDRVRVKGAWLVNPSPQRHVEIDSLQVVEAFQNPYHPAPYRHVGNALRDLPARGTSQFLVHAIAGNGQVLVTEFKDQIIPIFVQQPEWTRNLWRNDLVELAYQYRAPADGQPLHLALDARAAQPVRRTEEIQLLHGQRISIEGALILFPQAPGIRFNVFAVQQILVSDLSRQYTLVNFDSPTAFAAIRAKLQAAWDRNPTAFTNGRNKLLHNQIRVRATGLGNVVDPNQANPQILLESADDVEIVAE